jgi:uncharacterized protein (DUF1697 family)
MEITLAILRGINVGGHHKIPMADLKTLFQEAGFKHITTYIQSGNIVFENHHLLPAEISQVITAKIQDRYNFTIPVITRTLAEMESLLNQSPWPDNEQVDTAKLLVTFLDQVPPPELLHKLDAAPYAPDKFILRGREIWVYCPNGYGNTKLTNALFEKKLKVTATTRNWRTVTELYQIMKTYEAPTES